MRTSTSRRNTPAVAVVLALSLLIAIIMPVGPAHSDSRDPVILVHGWGMNSALTWGTIKPLLERDGFDTHTIDFDNNKGSNVEHAGELGEKVNQVLAETGASRVDLVVHSMGGLSARYYVKYLGGDSKVEDVVELGTPNHGSVLYNFFNNVDPSEGGFEMMLLSDFVKELNSGDETPGAVKWTTIFTLFDGIIIPSFSSMLEGARALMVWPPTNHAGLLSNQQVYDWVVEGLEGGGWNNN